MTCDLSIYLQHENNKNYLPKHFLLFRRYQGAFWMNGITFILDKSTGISHTVLGLATEQSEITSLFDQISNDLQSVI